MLVRLRLAVILWFVQCWLSEVQSCTVFLVGRDASEDGSVLVSHSNDGEFDTDPRLVKVPAADHVPGSMREIFFSPESYPRYVGYERKVPEYYPKQDGNGNGNGAPPPNHNHNSWSKKSNINDNASIFIPIGRIPQITHTYAYLEETYGAVNEMQVAIGESTCSGVFGAIPLGAPNGTALFSVDQLTQIAMERASSAREAVIIMGSLAEAHGFYGAGEFEGTAESLAVSDPDEAWIFHILPDPTGRSAIWAAQKIPSDSMAILANMFIIRQVDPDNDQDFLMSDSVHSVAMDYGWWRGVQQDGLLDFTRIYSDGEYAHKYYSGRRLWGGYHLACPSRAFPPDYKDLQSDPVYPVYARPDRLLSQKDIFRFHRYTYQGTQFDLGGQNLAAGPFSSPDRWKAGPAELDVQGNWERPIGLYRTSDTYVVQSRKSGTGAVLWFGPASPHGTVFTPFLVHLSDVPPSFRSGHQKTFDRSSMFWAACIVHNVANLKWSYAIHDVQARQEHLEQASIDMVRRMDVRYQLNRDMEEVELTYQSNIQDIVASLWSLSDEIMFKYASGFVNEPPDNMSQMVGYPSWWLKAVGYEDGPPPPPTTPKCCHPRNNANSSSDSVLRKHGRGRENKDEHRGHLPELTGKAAMKHYLKQS